MLTATPSVSQDGLAALNAAALSNSSPDIVADKMGLSKRKVYDRNFQKSEVIKYLVLKQKLQHISLPLIIKDGLFQKDTNQDYLVFLYKASVHEYNEGFGPSVVIKLDGDETVWKRSRNKWNSFDKIKTISDLHTNSEDIEVIWDHLHLNSFYITERMYYYLDHEKHKDKLQTLRAKLYITRLQQRTERTLLLQFIMEKIRDDKIKTKKPNKICFKKQNLLKTQSTPDDLQLPHPAKLPSTFQRQKSFLKQPKQSCTAAPPLNSKKRKRMSLSSGNTQNSDRSKLNSAQQNPLYSFPVFSPPNLNAIQYNNNNSQSNNSLLVRPLALKPQAHGYWSVQFPDSTIQTARQSNHGFYTQPLSCIHQQPQTNNDLPNMNLSLYPFYNSQITQKCPFNCSPNYAVTYPSGLPEDKNYSRATSYPASYQYHHSSSDRAELNLPSPKQISPFIDPRMTLHDPNLSSLSTKNILQMFDQESNTMLPIGALYFPSFDINQSIPVQSLHPLPPKQ
ncbi:uncharacterized protein LOC126323902 isoform X2 [Schistocerca gregaria]|uniref:uncharacterized protein LOC126323902 isoform X2 n=1 Tax=Schistocerca gregaria TaxID=7010 RepID=UPI00211EF148|nr:uncharacterized protein LOC126323902 isoform X2 [Schistocerca gregaria]